MVRKASLRSSFIEEMGKRATNKIMILASLFVAGAILSNADPTIIYAVHDINIPNYFFYLL